MSSIFETALSDFKTSLTPEENEDFKMTDLAALKQVLSKIQKDQENRRSMMYMKRLEPFLNAMETYGKVIEVFLNTSNILAFIWVRKHAKRWKISLTNRVGITRHTIV